MSAVNRLTRPHLWALRIADGVARLRAWLRVMAEVWNEAQAQARQSRPGHPWDE